MCFESLSAVYLSIYLDLGDCYGYGGRFSECVCRSSSIDKYLTACMCTQSISPVPRIRIKRAQHASAPLALPSRVYAWSVLKGIHFVTAPGADGAKMEAKENLRRLEILVGVTGAFA